jgi:hypothetical protein
MAIDRHLVVAVADVVGRLTAYAIRLFPTSRRRATCQIPGTPGGNEMLGRFWTAAAP